jgi:hypothetical protein
MVDEHPLLFPTTLRHASVYDEARAPSQFTDTCPWTTLTSVPRKLRPSDVESLRRGSSTVSLQPAKKWATEYNMRMVSAQDSMAWETQGAVTDRTQERLGVGDEGIILFENAQRADRKRSKGF